jgi:drug/metabolite transporter (DMT)-like permease
VPPLAIGLLLLSALMHTAWNGWMKGSPHKLAYIWTAQLAGIALYTLPVALTTSLAFPSSVLPFLLISAVCETGYIIAMSRGYGAGDLSLVYPLARGSSPVFVTLFSALALGERLPWAGYVGIGLLVVGIYLVSLPVWSDFWRPLRALAAPEARWAVLAGLFIAGYSLADKYGVAQMPPAAYNIWAFIGMNLASAPFVLRLEGWAKVRQTVQTDWRRVLGGGVFVMGTYFLVLWALTLAPASYVTAGRGISILLGTLWGAHILGEQFGPNRFVGAALMVTGLATLALRG